MQTRSDRSLTGGARQPHPSLQGEDKGEGASGPSGSSLAFPVGVQCHPDFHPPETQSTRLPVSTHFTAASATPEPSSTQAHTGAPSGQAGTQPPWQSRRLRTDVQERGGLSTLPLKAHGHHAATVGSPHPCPLLQGQVFSVLQLFPVACPQGGHSFRKALRRCKASHSSSRAVSQLPREREKGLRECAEWPPPHHRGLHWTLFQQTAECVPRCAHMCVCTQSVLVSAS